MFPLWPTERICPSCEGHCEIAAGYDYETGTPDSYTCSDCGGTGVMLWMMPSTKEAERRFRKFIEELIPITEL